MYFSCKLSNAVLEHYTRQGEDLVLFFEKIEEPAEFLRDPSYWLKADRMESLLELALRTLAPNQEPKEALTQIGHSAPELRSWGVLDSVLRMMPKPQEILSQPERFFSYFVSPEPPIEGLKKEKSSISFSVPVSATQYPLVTALMAASFESLPVFVGHSPAQVDWREMEFEIRWSEPEEDLFAGQDPGHQISPDLMRSIIDNLEKGQRELEERNRALLAQNEDLLRQQTSRTRSSKKNLAVEQTRLPMPENPELLEKLEWLGESAQQLRVLWQRAFDYQVRAQQLITLLIGQDRMSPQVREAMRRVDWDYIQASYPRLRAEAEAHIGALFEVKKEIHSVTEKKEEEPAFSSFSMDEVDLNDLLRRSLRESVRVPTLRLDEHLLLDRPVKAHAPSLESALRELFTRVADSMGGEGTIRVVTRPSGTRAELEISDTSSAKSPLESPDLFWIKEAIRKNEGRLQVRSSPGQGVTHTIQFSN